MGRWKDMTIRQSEHGHTGGVPVMSVYCHWRLLTSERGIPPVSLPSLETPMRHSTFFLLPLLAFGCTDSEDSDSDMGTDPDTGVDTEADTEAPGTQLRGTVTDVDGNGLEGVRVNLCRQVCTTSQTDSDGSYLMPGLLPQRYSLHIETHGDLDFADPAVAYDLPDSEFVDLHIVVPATTPVVLPNSAASVEYGTDLFLTLASGDLTLLFEDDPTHVSVARVGTDVALPVDLAGTIEAVWYMDPWSAEAEVGIAVEIRDTFSGVGGDGYQLYQLNYDDYEWEDRGTLTSDGSMLTGDATIERLDTLVLISVDND